MIGGPTQIANLMVPEHLFRGEQTEEWDKVPGRKFATESCQRTVAENPTEREAPRKNQEYLQLI